MASNRDLTSAAIWASASTDAAPQGSADGASTKRVHTRRRDSRYLGLTLLPNSACLVFRKYQEGSNNLALVEILIGRHPEESATQMA